MANKVFVDIMNSAQMSSCWIRGGSVSKLWGPYRSGGATDTDSQREEDHVIIEALIGVLPLQAKEYPELLVTVRR